MNAEDERVPPHNIQAEQAALGCMLTAESAAVKIAEIVTAGDFYRPAHQTVFEAISKVRAEDGFADPVRVYEYMRTHMGRPGRTIDGNYLHACVAEVTTTASAGYYAHIVRDHAVRRRIISTATDLAARAYKSEDVTGIAEAAVQEFESVRDFESGDEVTAQTITEFLAVEDEAHDWIVPGLLERGDRMIITGMEGLGKSMMLRHLAVMTAAGVHPFAHTPIEPKRVLIIDCENSAVQTRRKLRPMVTQARLQGYEITDTNLWLEIRPEGMDLAEDRDVSWLLKRVSLIRPDVVVIGPLYRLVPRALNSDDEAAPILAALNLVRARGACVLMEAHAGHAVGAGGTRDLRPRGSSALMGWPEFGYGLRSSQTPPPDGGRRVELVPWRGDRDEREWPEELKSHPVWTWVDAVPGADPKNPYANAAQNGDRR